MDLIMLFKITHHLVALDLIMLFNITHNLVALDFCSFFGLTNYTSTRGHNYKLVKPICNNNAPGRCSYEVSSNFYRVEMSC